MWTYTFDFISSTMVKSGSCQSGLPSRHQVRLLLAKAITALLVIGKV